MKNESDPGIKSRIIFDQSSPEVVPRITDGQDTFGRPLVGLESIPRDTAEAISVPLGSYAFKAGEIDRPVEPRA